MLKDININENVDGYYLLQRCEMKVTKNGSNYLDLNLGDRSEMISGKCWSVPDHVLANMDKLLDGSFVYVKGTIEEYNGNRQMRVAFIRPISDSEKFNKRDLIPIVEENPVELIKEIKDTIDSIIDEDIRKICLTVLNENKKDIATAPAAQSVHHSEIGGLALHICEMLRVGKAIIGIFPHINRDYLLAGIFLHDIGKIREMKRNNVGLVSDYTNEGKLLGHIVICVSYVDEIGKKLGISSEKYLPLEHMILSHHDKPEYGSPKSPMFIEAEMLHYCDMISSRANIFYHATKDIESGTFGMKHFALGCQPYRI